GRVDLGRAAVEAGVACAIDVSDGLLQDLGHVAERSDVGVEIDIVSLPLHPAAVEALGPQRAMDLALGGGEDFELALAGPADVLVGLSTPELPVTVIGLAVEAHAGKSWALTIGGDRYEPPVAGWDQLRRQSAP
ncbi:MAG: thiamine-phosphate kinase, partial [Dehalococcoidia bacterium]|nr:thiamine-phosphate kinase [Dehalococcoidia bacterium]